MPPAAQNCFVFGRQQKQNTRLRNRYEGSNAASDTNLFLFSADKKERLGYRIGTKVVSAVSTDVKRVVR